MVSSVCTELMNVNFYWLANTGVLVYKTLEKNLAYMFALTSLAVPRMVCEMEGIWLYSCCFVECNISSHESDVSICIGKAEITNDRLMNISKSDHSDKIKQEFFQTATISVLLYGYTNWTWMKYLQKMLDGNYKWMLHAGLN